MTCLKILITIAANKDDLNTFIYLQKMSSFCSKNPALVILSLGGIALALYVLIGPFSPHVLNQWENTENVRRMMLHFRVQGMNKDEKY